jgi:MFS family permease
MILSTGHRGRSIQSSPSYPLLASSLIFSLAPGSHVSFFKEKSGINHPSKSTAQTTSTFSWCKCESPRIPSQVSANNFRGLGGIFFIPFISSWGRAPVLFWTSLLGTGFTLGCCITKNFTTFYGLRVLMGFFLTALQTIGLSFIQDMFFFHEHARKIGIWSAFYLASPYLGPLFGNFIISGTGAWRPVFWVVFALGCLNLILIVAFIDEPWYNRKMSLRQQPARGSRLMRVLGVWQIKHHAGNFLTIKASCTRLIEVLFKPIMIPVMIY